MDIAEINKKEMKRIVSTRLITEFGPKKMDYISKKSISFTINQRIESGHK
jgi:hypothetical protein